MWGGVGRGKSFLMDCFFQAVPLTRKTRLHFHEFMREVHRELQDLKGTVNPLDELGRRIARRYRLICFDEFHVADVTDAMILHRLLQSLFDNRVSIVTTSNFHPDGLYPNGLHRDRILPAIELLKAAAGGHQRRRRHRLPPAARLEQVDLYHCPLGARGRRADAKAFDRLAEARDEDPVLHIEHRELQARAAPAAWCGSTSAPVRRAALAERLPGDRLALPHRAAVRRATDAARMASEARRFTWLVDVLYDRRVKLVMSAEVPAEALYTEGPLAHEFPRTVSRLVEMQSAEFLALERRDVDTNHACRPGCRHADAAVVRGRRAGRRRSAPADQR
jgi:cell division protein ZapE